MPLPPGPRGPRLLQTIGYALAPTQMFDRAARRFGDPFTLSLPGFGDFVMLTAPDLIKLVFTGDPDALHAGEANEILEPVVGSHSVLRLDGAEHLRQRRLLLSPLHGERMAAYGSLMAEIADAAIARMPVGERFALHPHMQSITLQVILRAVFGLDEGAHLDELAALLVEFMQPPPSVLAFVPPRWFEPLARLPFGPYHTFLERRERVDRAIRGIVRARREALDPARTDILSLLLQARDEEGRAMTDDELRDELVTMLVAGHETTATALTWTCALLLTNPEVATRLQSEIDAAPLETWAESLVASSYLDAVIKESLRLRPIVPDVVRRLKRPMQIGNYEIPEGVFLAPCIYLAHRRAESWPEPERFLPERFLGARIDPYTWFPFGGGIRRCLGMAFALYEMKVVLGVLLRGARLSLATRDPLRVERRSVTLAPARGLPVTLARRAPASDVRKAMVN